MTHARAALIATALMLSGCATTAHYGSDRIAQKDPLEKLNRKVYKFDRAIDKAVVRPAAKVYTKIVPEAGRRGVTNFFNNAEEPRNFINAVLQGKPKVALKTLARFIINTTLGVGGLADHATGMGLPPQKEDFGQTFVVWGIGSGPYLVLPVLGPSTLRDAAGQGVAYFGDPFRVGLRELDLQWWLAYPLTGIELLDLRSQLLDTADKLLNGSADEYATVRSAYLQNRRNEIYDGNPPDDDAASPADMPGDGAAAKNGVPPAAGEPAPTARIDLPLNIDPGPAAIGESAQLAAVTPSLNQDPGPAVAAPPLSPAPPTSEAAPQ